VPLTNGSGSGSCYFRHWPSRRQQKTIFSEFLSLLLFEAGLRIRIHFIRIRIRVQLQHFRLNTDPDPDPIRIQGFNDHKLKKKNYSWKKN
jgi:hypothetical protein